MSYIVRRVASNRNVGPDSAAIAQALSELQWTSGDYEQGILELEGFLSITEPISINCNPDGTYVTGQRPIAIHGIGDAALRWDTTAQDDYVIRMYGEGRTALPAIKGLRIYGDYQTRGIMLAGMRYRKLVSDLYLYQTHQVGLDLVDCWGADARNIYTEACGGVVVRAHGFNGSSLKSSRIEGLEAYDSNDSGNTIAMLQFEILNGETLTRSTYPGYTDYWPDPADTSVKRTTSGGGGNVQTPLDKRCAMQVTSSGSYDINDVLFEQCYYGDKSLINAFPDRSTLRNIYFEFAYARYGLRIPTVTSGEYTVANWGDLHFSNLGIANNDEPDNWMWHLVYGLDTQTNGLVVRDGRSQGLKTGVINFDGGEHWNPTVHQLATRYNEIDPADRIKLDGGAIVHPGVPWKWARAGQPVDDTIEPINAITDATDATAPRGSLYRVGDVLKYKTSAGLVQTINTT